MLFKLLGETGYEHFQFLGKLKDIHNRLVEEPEMQLFSDFIGPTDQVLDIGANYAYHTHRMAGLCPFGLVFAFEPIPFTHRVCERIVRHFKLDNVRLYPLGVGARSEKACFRVPLVEFGAISGGQAHLSERNNQLDGKAQHYRFEKSREIVCQLVALDQFLPPLPRLSFVKMDIEGAEFFALQGMRRLLEQSRPLLMLEINPFFLNGFGISPDELAGLLTGLGYEFFRFEPAMGSLVRHRGEFIEANYLMLTPRHQEIHKRRIEGP